MAVDPRKFIKEFFREVNKGNVKTFAPLLPLFKIGEEHMSTELHYQLAPFFKFEQPRSTVYMCSRQVGKSFGLSAQTILRSHFYKGFHTLIIEPRADQLARYNTTILRPLIKSSLIREDMIDAVNMSKFYVKEFHSGSLIYLEYCFLNPERVRGISGAAAVAIDECQDIEYDHIPVIMETMSASRRFGLQQFTGTPKTSDGTLSVLWDDSSQAEWCIPCKACNKKNIPAMDQDLIKMIGKKTVVCAKCGRPIDGRDGYYVHGRPERAATHAGYHFSQVTHPLHYGIKEKWQALLDKMDGPGCYPKAKFYNEVLGVPCDENVKLLSMSDLIAVANSDNPNTIERACQMRNRYSGYIMGVDWSGGGDMAESFTAIAIVGFRSGTDVVDCVYAERIPMGSSPEEEAAYIMDLFRKMQCVYLAHDYGGAGYVRESLMRQAGLPDHQIIPYTYVHSTNKDVITYNPPSGAGTRFSYSIDKARSLAIMCAMVRAHKITLPNYEVAKQVVDDMLNLIEIPKELPRGNMMYLIGRAPKKPDDFAHALNYAASAVWYTRQSYPDLSTISEKFKASKEKMELATPPDPSAIPWK